MGNVFKVIIVVVLLFMAFGFIYKILFKLGVLALLILAGLYLYKKVFASK